MLSVFDHGAPAPCPAPFNLAAHVLGRADAQPDKPALSVLGATGADTLSYAQLQQAVLLKKVMGAMKDPSNKATLPQPWALLKM